MYLITKLQNLKAIHNDFGTDDSTPQVVSNYKITKSESYSQQKMWKLQNQFVVSNYKITKSESYSQLLRLTQTNEFVVSNYKITKSESYSQPKTIDLLTLSGCI